MYSAKSAFSWLMVLLLAAPLVGQSPPGVLQGGTYNTPAGAGAAAPVTPSPPLGNPIAPFYNPGLPFGQPALLSPQNFSNRDILNPSQGIWLQLLQQQDRKSVHPTPGQQGERMALIKVFVPTADTQLWVNDQPTRQKGRERIFRTPFLEPGTYRYRFRASWLAGKTPVSAVQTVTFQPATTPVVDFAKKP